MPIPDGVARFVISGTLAQSHEIFNTAFYVSGFTPESFPTDEGLGVSVASAPWTNFLTSAAALASIGTLYNAVDAYYLVGGVAVAHSHAAINKAGTGGTNHPTQVSCVMTLRSATATRSGRGRMYLPATGATMDANGLFTTTVVNPAVDNLALLLAVYQLDPLNPVVVSQTNSTSYPLVSVDADLVPDIQRRRANQLTSTRHSATIGV